MRPEEKRVGAGLPTLVGGRSAAGVFSYSVKTCWTESWVGFDEPAPIVYVDWAFDGRWGENYPYGVVEAESFSSSATLPLAVAPQCATLALFTRSLRACSPLSNPHLSTIPLCFLFWFDRRTAPQAGRLQPANHDFTCRDQPRMVQSSITSWLTKKSAPESAAASQSSIRTGLLSASSQAVTSKPSPEQKSNEPRAHSTASRALSKPWLLPNAEISYVTEDNVSQFRRLVTVLLPATYTDKFYAETLADEVISSVSRLALWKDEAGDGGKVVAGIRCKVFVSSLAETTKGAKDAPDEPSLYISTIGTLAPFRNHGLATMLLRDVMWRAVQDYGISTVTAHVWEANEEARAWYAKLGFEEAKYEADYYRKLRPMGAWLLQRRVLASDFMTVGEGIQ